MVRRSSALTRVEKGRPGAARYWELARRLGVSARQGKTLRGFLDDVARGLLEFTGADAIEIWLRSRGNLVRHSTAARPSEPSRFIAAWRAPPADAFEARCLAMLAEGDEGDPGGEAAPANGEDTDLLLPLGPWPEGPGSVGVVALKLSPEARDRLDLPLLKEVLRDLALAVEVREAHASLRERMKELDCLYRVALILEQPATTLDEVLQQIVPTLPDAWLHPEHAWVRLEVDETSYEAGGSPQRDPRLEADVVVGGIRRGRLALGYTTELPVMDDGPFLAEERTLIWTVAREIALIIERHEVAEESRRLEEQFEHAERLATIGEVAAGIGHELNDPLNHILGYARLIAKRDDLPDDVLRDADMVVTSALHARDTIRQLLTFARRMPQQRTQLLLGDVVQHALPLLQALSAKRDIDIVTDLAADLPTITADPGQLRQVLVNLVANAVHAMPDGGRVTIATRPPEDDDRIHLVVEDTGVGMTDEVTRNAFLPFFTTREHGTGLGLSVVHGIVDSLGGTIRLESRVGHGSRFEIAIPAALPTEATADHAG